MLTTTTPLVALEWFAFGLGAFTVYLYGHTKVGGGICGMITAIVFMIWGSFYDFYGAMTINIGFFSLHTRNMYRAVWIDKES